MIVQGNLLMHLPLIGSPPTPIPPISVSWNEILVKITSRKPEKVWCVLLTHQRQISFPINMIFVNCVIYRSLETWLSYVYQLSRALHLDEREARPHKQLEWVIGDLLTSYFWLCVPFYPRTRCYKNNSEWLPRVAPWTPPWACIAADDESTAAECSSPHCC